MSPASYLTAPPRGVPQMLAACNSRGGLASRGNREKMEVDTRATSRHADFGSPGRAPRDVACPRRVVGLPRPAPADSVLALLAAIRGCPRARMPVRGRGRADGGAALAVHRVELVHPRAALAGDSVQRDDVLRPSHSALRRRGWRRR